MKKSVFLLLPFFLLLLSCGKSYVDKVEDVCLDAVERIKIVEAMDELDEVMKDFEADIRQLVEDNITEAEKCCNSTKGDAALYKRWVKARNTVSDVVAVKYKELVKKSK